MINSLYPIFQHWSEKGSVYIISDTHFEDSDCKLMNPDWITPEEQVKIINSMVHKNDTLIHLGDVGNPEWIAKLKAGHKVLIMGNHDKGKNVYLRKKTKTIVEFNTFEKQEEAFDKHEIDYMGTEYHKPFIYGVKIQDNHLFDEVYEGCLFISDKILLSHEPVYGLPWCLNIHGHDHNGVEPYKEGCKHINLAANVCNYTPINLGKIIKNGVLRDIDSIHRQTINRAIKSKGEEKR